MRFTPLFLLVSLVSPATPSADEVLGECALGVVAQGVRSENGNVGFLLFRSKEGWPRDRERAFMRQGVAARTGDVEVLFDGLSPGSYAVVVTHDENGNKELDCTPSGRPLEGWGMSNNPKARFKAPGFQKAVVQVACGDRIEVRLRYRKKKSATAAE